MVNVQRIADLCHIEVFRRIPLNLVEELQIRHIRFCDDAYTFNPRGGHTEVDVTIDNIIFEGRAVCSKSDNYCKKTGRELAFKRAIREYWDYVKEGNDK